MKLEQAQTAIQLQATDNWWANLIVGLLDRGEWRTLIFGLLLTFAATYALKLVYFSLINPRYIKRQHIRLLAIAAGFVAAWGIWGNEIAMPWYIAGILLGPLSIALHHILLGISAHKPFKHWAPWLYPFLKGERDKRKYQKLMIKTEDRRA